MIGARALPVEKPADLRAREAAAANAKRDKPELLLAY
jgi:hypothetical protein